MKLAIIGAGNVGGALWLACAQKAGHEIFFGVRDPKAEKTQTLLRAIGGKARAGTVAEAAAFADVSGVFSSCAATDRNESRAATSARARASFAASSVRSRS